MASPHRTTPLVADLSLEIDGIPYSARITLTPGKLPKRSPGLSLVRMSESMTERANCVACAYFKPARLCDSRCRARQDRSLASYTGHCAFFTPSPLTRLLRAFRLGRPAVYLASPKALESAPADTYAAPNETRKPRTRTGVKTGKVYV